MSEAHIFLDKKLKQCEIKNLESKKFKLENSLRSKERFHTVKVSNEELRNIKSKLKRLKNEI